MPGRIPDSDIVMLSLSRGEEGEVEEEEQEEEEEEGWGGKEEGRSLRKDI